jgi:hypothetical protein
MSKKARRGQEPDRLLEDVTYTGSTPNWIARKDEALRDKGEVLQKLEGGDRRSIGRVDEVVAEVLADSSLFEVVFEGMLSNDPIVRMRSADAIEKISAKRPKYLQPFKSKLIQEVATSEQQEVRWHVAQMLPRLRLDTGERSAAVRILLDYLEDTSKIVKTFSMHALADMAEQDPSLRARFIPILKELTETGSPAMKSRGRKLLRRLETFDSEI